MVLYVDYDIGERMLVAATLQARGFRVRSAESALDAMDLVSTQSFDVVIIDYDLPDMTGPKLAQTIRAVEPSVRVILFSVRPHLPAEELACVDVHIVKGSAIDQLTEVIAAFASLICRDER
jgi:DNA-binding NtrC family response regulator